MAQIPLAMAVAAPIMQAVGGYQQADAEAGRMRTEAGLLEANARTVQQQTAIKEGLQRRRAGAVLGEQRAAIAQSGFAPSGTMGDIATQSGTEAELDALATRYEGAVQAQSMQGQAAQLRAGARQTKRAAGIGLATSFLTGAASGYGTYAATGGTPDKLGFSALGPRNVMRHSAIPGGFASADSASNILRGYGCLRSPCTSSRRPRRA